MNTCFDLFAGKELVDDVLEQGAHVLTPGWLREWREYLIGALALINTERQVIENILELFTLQATAKSIDPLLSILEKWVYQCRRMTTQQSVDLPRTTP